MGSEKLVNEITFRAHDLDAVVLGLLSQAGAGDEILNLLLDTLFVQLMGLERVDRCLNGTGCDRLRAVGITPGVQDLHANLAIGFVYRTGHDLMLFSLFNRAQLGGTGIHATFYVRANTARHHQAHATAGALGKVSGHALETTRLLFQPGVHGAHQGAVTQGGKTQIQRSQKVRVVSSGHRNSRTGSVFTECCRPKTGRQSVMC